MYCLRRVASSSYFRYSLCSKLTLSVVPYQSLGRFITMASTSQPNKYLDWSKEDLVKKIEELERYDYEVALSLY